MLSFTPMPPRSYLLLRIPEHPLRRALDMPFPPNPNLLTELHSFLTLLSCDERISEVCPHLRLSQ